MRKLQTYSKRDYKKSPEGATLCKTLMIIEIKLRRNPPVHVCVCVCVCWQLALPFPSNPTQTIPIAKSIIEPLFYYLPNLG